MRPGELRRRALVHAALALAVARGRAAAQEETIGALPLSKAAADHVPSRPSYSRQPTVVEESTQVTQRWLETEWIRASTSPANDVVRSTLGLPMGSGSSLIDTIATPVSPDASYS